MSSESDSIPSIGLCNDARRFINTHNLEKPPVSNPILGHGTMSEKDPLLVTFDGVDDQEDVSNLPDHRKWLIVLMMCATAVVITCTSTIWTLAFASTSFNSSSKVNRPNTVSLPIALYILGLYTGAKLKSLKDIHGRKIGYLSTLFLTTCFEALTAFGKFGKKTDGIIPAVRHAAGIFSAAFLTGAAGVFSDLFCLDHRNSHIQHQQYARALILYSVTPVIGVGLGFCILHAIANELITFLWSFIALLILCVVMWTVIVMVPETYQPELLERKARRIRKSTGNSSYHTSAKRAKSDESIINSLISQILAISRHQMTFALCFYTGFASALFYVFVAFPNMVTNVYYINTRQVGEDIMYITVSSCAILLACNIFKRLKMRWDEHYPVLEEQLAMFF